MFKVTFRGKIAIDVDLEQEASLLTAANRVKAPLSHRCGGHGRCGTCLVNVEQGAQNLSPAGTTESRVLRILKARANQRLACQAWVKGDVACSVG